MPTDHESLLDVARRIGDFTAHWANRYAEPGATREAARALKDSLAEAGFGCDPFGHGQGMHGWRCERGTAFADITIDHAGGEPTARATAWARIQGVESAAKVAARAEKKATRAENAALAACRSDVDALRGSLALEQSAVAEMRPRLAACERSRRDLEAVVNGARQRETVERMGRNPTGDTETERRFKALEFD